MGKGEKGEINQNKRDGKNKETERGIERGKGERKREGREILLLGLL